MLQGVNTATWENENQQLINSKSIMKISNSKTSTDSVAIILRNVFWTIVAGLNIIILGDFLIFHGIHFMDLLIILTGGYRN